MPVVRLALRAPLQVPAAHLRVGDAAVRAVLDLPRHRGRAADRRPARSLALLAAARSRAAAAGAAAGGGARSPAAADRLLPGAADAGPAHRRAAAELRRRAGRRLAQHDASPTRPTSRAARPRSSCSAPKAAICSARSASASRSGCSRFADDLRRRVVAGRAAVPGRLEPARRARSLRGADELDAVPLAGLVVLTDGADNSGARSTSSILELKSRGVPVYPIGLGRERFDRDVAGEPGRGAARACCAARR